MSKKKNKKNADTFYQNLNKQDRIVECCCSKETNSCCQIKKNNFDNPQCNKSRLTIYGQLGRTANDNYTLKYAAKLNDTPITTEFMSSYKKPDNEDYEHKLKTFTSHGVQVNLNISDSIYKQDKIFFSSNDQAIQCNFEVTPESNPLSPATLKEELNILKKCNSPVVVISVYPKPDLKISSDKVLRRAKSTLRSENIKNTKKDTRQSKKSRSASPTPKKSRNKITRDNNLNIEKETIQTKTGRRFRNEIKSTNTAKKISNRSVGSCPGSCQMNETNTTKVKKALVENFIKNIDSNNDDYSEFLFSVPKTNTSKITIDLEGKKEHYDVVLKKSQLKPHQLSVRKTLTEKSNNKSRDSKNISSVENFLMLKNKNFNDKRSQIKSKNKNLQNQKANKLASIQDSLELNHSREIKSGHVLRKNDKNNYGKSGVPGSTKHYRGDNCSLQDPNLRDMEIKKLLGLLRNQHNARNNNNTSDIFLKRAIITDPNTTKLIFLSSTHIPKDNGDQNKGFGDNIQNDQTKLPNKNEFGIPVIVNDEMNQHLMNLLQLNCLYSKQPPDTSSDYFSRKLQNKSHHLVLNHNYIFFKVQPHKRRLNTITKNQLGKLKRNTASTGLDNPNVKKIDGIKFDLDVSKVRRIMKKIHFDQAIQTEPNEVNYEKCIQTEINNNLESRTRMNISLKHKRKLNSADVLLKVDSKRKIKQTGSIICPRSTISAMEFQNIPNTFLTQNIPKSYFNFKGDGIGLKTKKVVKDAESVEFIFKGHKRSATPNLGTSTISKQSSSSTAIDLKLKPSKIRVKQHFLRRLMSYLVMRFHQDSRTSHKQKEKTKLPTDNTSIDSYQINTSLAAWDMSSALYDTTTSFYTSHTVHSMSKTKRGFFSSVCGFLNRRKI